MTDSSISRWNLLSCRASSSTVMDGTRPTWLARLNRPGVMAHSPFRVTDRIAFLPGKRSLQVRAERRWGH